MISTKFIIKRKSNKMRIGHQLFDYLQYWTDTGSYCAKDSVFFKDAEGRRLCIKEMYINYEEKQVYIVVEDENQNLIHKSVNEFIKMMGGPKPDNYVPLYHLRDEVKQVKRLKVRKLKQAVNKYDPEIKKLVKQIFKKLRYYESDRKLQDVRPSEIG